MKRGKKLRSPLRWASLQVKSLVKAWSTSLHKNPRNCSKVLSQDLQLLAISALPAALHMATGVVHTSSLKLWPAVSLSGGPSSLLVGSFG